MYDYQGKVVVEKSPGDKIVHVSQYGFIGLVLAIHLRGHVLLDPVKETADCKHRCYFDGTCFDESLKIFFQVADSFNSVVDKVISRTNIWHVSS